VVIAGYFVVSQIFTSFWTKRNYRITELGATNSDLLDSAASIDQSDSDPTED
jgi:hypothetical protein